MQHQENLIQCIRRQLANSPAEKIVLCNQENLRNLLKRQLVLIVQAKHLKEKRSGYGCLQSIQPVDAGIQCCSSFAAESESFLSHIIKYPRKKGVDLL